MPDYVAILKRSIAALPDDDPAMRQAVYDRARAALARQLTSVTPALNPVEIETHHRGLEDAIVLIEDDYPQALPEPDFRPPETIAEAEAEAEAAFVEDDGLQPDLVDEPPGHVQSFPPRPAKGPVVMPSARTPPLLSPVAAPVAKAASPKPAAPPPARTERVERPRRSFAGLAAVLVLLALVGGLGAAAYLYRDDLPRYVDSLATLVGMGEPAVPTPGPAPTGVTEVIPSPAPPPKIGERLGGDADPAPQPDAGRGVATAPATPPAPAPAPAPAAPPVAAPAPAPTPGPSVAATDPAAAPAPPGGAPLVAQRAFFLEQGTNGATSSSTNGQIAWTQVDRDNGPPAIRGVLEFPDRKVTATILITKNADEKLPASHLIEISFSGEGALSTAPIERVPALVLKPSEQARGQPLTGAAIPVTEKVYWIALTDETAQETRNVALLKDSEWFDMPILFKDGKRALLVFEKGVPGDKVFEDVLTRWSQS